MRVLTIQDVWRSVLRPPRFGRVSSRNSVSSGTGRPVAPLASPDTALVPAMSRCAHLYVFAKRREEARRGDGASRTAAKVAHVGEIALELILILVEHRQTPGAVARLVAATQQLVGKLVVVREAARW